MKIDKKRKQKALELLASGTPVSTIAEKIEVSRSTIYNWINYDQDFKEVKKGLDLRMVDDLYSVAVLEAEEMLINGKSHEKLAIITQLFKIKHKDQVDVNVKPLTFDQLVEKMGL